MSLDDEQERQRAAAAKRKQDAQILAVSPPAFLVSTLPSCRPAATVGVLAMRAAAVSDPQQQHQQQHPWGHASHVVCNHVTALSVYAVHWTQEAVAVSAEAADESMQGGSHLEWSLQLEQLPLQPEVLGTIQQMASLSWPDAQGRPRDLLVLTSDSGFLSLLSLERGSGGHLRAKAHARIANPGLGRRQVGALLRVSGPNDGSPAIAVASREAHHKSGAALRGGGAVSAPSAFESEGSTMLADHDWTAGEGGILVYPLAASSAAAAATAASSSAAMSVDSGATAPAATGSSSDALPELRSPIAVPFDGVLTALAFLPPHPAHPERARLMLSVVPRAHGRHDDDAARRVHLSIVQLDFATGLYTSTLYPTQLGANELMLDILVVDPPGDTAGPASASAAAAASSTVDKPCFVLLQLESRVLLLDVNSRSTLRFPASLPLPSWSEQADQSLQRSVGTVPLITAWTWLRGRHLLCTTETGEVHMLYLWWNEIGAARMPPEGAAVEQWMRWVPLSLATPSACMLALAPPALDAASSSSQCDLLWLPGEAAEGMLLRVDWSALARNNEASKHNASARALATSTPSSLHLTAPSMRPMEPALERERHLSNLAPLLDFVVHAPAATAATPSAQGPASQQLFACSGMGRHGALRVLRPNTLEGELIDVDGSSSAAGASSAENKIFTALLPLRRPSATHSPSMDTVGLVYSFVGSTRVRAMQEGALEDVSDALAAGGFELGRTTLQAAFVAEGRVLLQVDDRAVRALALQEPFAFAATRSLAAWSPADAASSSDSSAVHFTHAHVCGDLVLLALPASRTVVLLQCRVAADASQASFVVLGQARMGSDVSAVHIDETSRRSANGTSGGDAVLCMVATHDAQLSFFKAALQAGDSASASASLLLLHTMDLSRSVGKEVDSSAVAESLLVCAGAGSTELHLFIGLRNGHFVAGSFHPQGSATGSSVLSAMSADGWLRHSIVRRVGAARVKLVRIEGTGASFTSDICLLALSDQTFVVQVPQAIAEGDAAQPGVRVRELVWPRDTALSSALQFAVPFVQADGGLANGVACVIDGRFHLAEIDPMRCEASTSSPILLGGTPRRVLVHPPTGLLCVLTVDQTASGSVSRLLLVNPSSGRLCSEFDFAAAGAALGQSETAHSLMIWPHPSNTYIVVGSATRRKTDQFSLASLHCFVVERASAEVGAAEAPMDISDSAAPSQASLSSSVAPVSSGAAPGSFVLRRTQLWLTSLHNKSLGALKPSGRAWCASPIFKSKLALAVATDSHVYLLHMKADAVVGAAGHALSTASVSETTSTAVDLHFLQPEKVPLLVAVDMHQGVSIYTVGERLVLKCIRTDPYARLARQVVPWVAHARMQVASTLPAFQTGNPLALSDAAAAAITALGSSSKGPEALVVRAIGFDVFGRVFVLRQDPSNENAIVGVAKAAAAAAGGAAASATPRPSGAAAASPHVPAVASTSASASSAPAAAGARPAPYTLSTSLVQEASYQLGVTPSRVRQVVVSRRGGGGGGAEKPLFLLSSMAGSVHAVREIEPTQARWLRELQTLLAAFGPTRSLVANHHASVRAFHGGDTPALQSAQQRTPNGSAETMIDGDLLATFFTLSHAQQQQLCGRLAPGARGGVEASSVREELRQVLNVQF